MMVISLLILELIKKPASEYREQTMGRPLRSR